MDSTTANPPAQQDVVELIRLVRALLSYREERRETLAAEAASAQAESEAKCDPVDVELRSNIRAIGERLHLAGGLSAMEAASDAVEDEFGIRAAVVVDRAWDRIGDEWFT